MYLVNIMLTIKENSIYQYEIKKSKFITLLYKINSIDEVNKLLEETKKKYFNATHYCYAYKIKNIQKFSDDGEPSGTAGLPIMEVLNKKDLDYILCIVVRYFGGIKLGAGGLVRAYSKAIREAIDNNTIIKLVEGYLVQIETDYDNQKQYDYLFTDKIIKKEFNEKIIYYLELKKEDMTLIKNINYKILEERMIKEECVRNSV